LLNGVNKGETRRTIQSIIDVGKSEDEGNEHDEANQTIETEIPAIARDTDFKTVLTSSTKWAAESDTNLNVKI
jgi:hypothetical protein